jgi:hypothetical protein
MIVGVHSSHPVVRCSADPSGDCAQRPLLANVRGDTVEASIAGAEQKGGCLPPRAGAADARLVMCIAMDVRRGGDAGADGACVLPSGAHPGQDGDAHGLDRHDTLRAVRARWVLVQSGAGRRRTAGAPSPRSSPAPVTNPPAALTRIGRSVYSQVGLVRERASAKPR